MNLTKQALRSEVFHNHKLGWRLLWNRMYCNMSYKG
jgi:hypothetical protein